MGVESGIDDTDLENEENGSEGEDKEKPAAPPPVDQEALAEATARKIAEIQVQRENAKTQDQPSAYNQVKKLMLEKGFDSNSVDAATLIAQAIVEDKLREVEVRSAQQTAAQLQDAAVERIEREVEKYHDKIPQLKWANSEVINRVEKLFLGEKEFAGAREKFKTGKLPSGTDFEKAVFKVVEVFCNENGINKSGNQLDNKNSKIQTKSGEGANGEPYQTEAQRDIYFAVLNATRDTKAAKEAVKNFAQQGL